ncbi:MAG: sulfite exporter TauE/SafE family protein [Candidatus Hinthialibacter sp.]
MARMIIISFLIFITAVSMSMVGKGGGNFYVVILAIAGVPIHEAATTGQFILFLASIAAMIIFQKNKSISWTLALLVGAFTSLSALGGGYFSHEFSGFSLKILFASMLLIAGVIMLMPVAENPSAAKTKHGGIITLKSGSELYHVNLWIASPIMIGTGFAAGMSGVSGGSFLVPLMTSACAVPMHTAVGTASLFIASTSLMGFTGHAIQGDFNPSWAAPLAIIAIAGGVLGGKLSLKTKPKPLKKLFAYTNWFAALLMMINAFHTKGIQ